MAKVQLAAIITQMAGKVGNTVFGRSAYNQIVRERVSPANPSSTRQSSQRSRFTTATAAWASLTDDQRTAWAAYADTHPGTSSFGQSAKLKPNAMYVRVNSWRSTLGLAATAAPPAAGVVGPALSTLAADSAETNIIVTLASAPNAADLYMVWTSRGQSPGAAAAGASLRLAKAGTVGNSAAFTVHPTTLNESLSFASGNRVFYRLDRFDRNGVLFDSSSGSVIAEDL